MTLRFPPGAFLVAFQNGPAGSLTTQAATAAQPQWSRPPQGIVYQPDIQGPTTLKIGDHYVMSVKKPPPEIAGTHISWWIDGAPRALRSDLWQIQGRGSKVGRHTLRIEVSNADKTQTFASATKVVTVTGALPAVADTGWAHFKGFAYAGSGYNASVADYVASTGTLLISMPPYVINMSPGELHYLNRQTGEEGWGKGSIDDRTLTLNIYKAGQYTEHPVLAQTITLTRP